MSIPDAFLRGKLVDENGIPPRSAHFSVLTEGNCQGERGIVRVQGDHPVGSDGTFTSPGLVAGRYYLRFFGMLRGDAASADDMQPLVFDFIYPNAGTVLEASPFDLLVGESIESVFYTPRPTWFNVGGRINTSLNINDYSRVSVLFQRDMGILPDVGGTGLHVGVDGTFHGILLKGTYTASVHEMAEQGPSGFTRSVRNFGGASVVIARDTLDIVVPRN